MTESLNKALFLLDRSRHDLAEAELRQVLANEPGNAFAHSLLALCLAKREDYQAATEEARQAIHLAPDLAFAHYAHAMVLHGRDRYDEALAAIQEALRLEPDSPNYLWLLGAIHFAERRWPAALEAAEHGLRMEPENGDCLNLRAMALVKLGRKEEASRTMEGALARDPENAVTHANQGWAWLERREPAKALEHFREALRLDPELEWARAGIVEALKARNFIYAIALRYFLWMSKLTPRAQFGIILGGYFANRILVGVSRSNPDLAPFILPFRIIYVAFVVLTWTADPLFNLLLRLNRFGRLVLSREQTIASNWVGSCVGLALAGLLGYFVAGYTPLLNVALVFGLLVIPLAGTFNCPAGWPRKWMARYTAGMAMVGILAMVLEFADSTPGAKGGPPGPSALLFAVFFLAAFFSSWVANFLITRRPRK